MKDNLVKFLGCGDAFGSGGRMQTCIFLNLSDLKILLDCGATSLVAMRKFDINPNDINTIFISHLHGDHFGGLPFFILDAQLASFRDTPLTIAGPKGTQQRLNEAMEVLFPGSSQKQKNYSLDVIEIEPGSFSVLNGINTSAYQVTHSSGAPSLAYKLEYQGKVIAYTGDTEWNDNIITAADGTDLLITETFSYDKEIKNHLNYKTLMKYKDKLKTKRIIMTHMSDDMLKMLENVECDYAEDGKEFFI
ncbi:MAG: MBL fold metallo-hydrolase [Clostridiales bacterium]|nr:MBL fold metallo-hydrolase [Clostridiales bacterium]MCF8022334.1 MBL fold metallo-hydrolase [Clostridiales bacterium]